MNGDGFDDIVIGAWPTNVSGGIAGLGKGAAYVVFGSALGYGDHLELGNLNGSNGFRIDGLHINDGLGRAVGSAGDFNGDGYGDLLLGAPNVGVNGAFGAGAGYVVFGHAGGYGALLDLAGLSGGNGFMIEGFAAGNQTVRSMAAAGDMNGDGYDDILIGASGGNGNAILDEKTYVLFGHAGALPAV